MYSVQVKATGRYIVHCDENWYEATKEELRIFTKEQAEAIAKQMRNHYVYSVIISNGEETYEVGNKIKPAPAQKVKSSIGKIKIKF